MIVVSDTSPLRALERLGLSAHHAVLYGSVVVPPAVSAELAVDVLGQGVFSLASYRFTQVRSPRNTGEVVRLSAQLGTGEAEAIVLAVELNHARLLVDDGEARAVAASLGLPHNGVLTVLADLKDLGVVQRMAPMIEQLQSQIQFRLAPEVIKRALRRVGEAE